MVQRPANEKRIIRSKDKTGIVRGKSLAGTQHANQIDVKIAFEMFSSDFSSDPRAIRFNYQLGEVTLAKLRCQHIAGLCARQEFSSYEKHVRKAREEHR